MDPAYSPPLDSIQEIGIRLDDVTGIVWRQQTRDNPPDFTNVNLNFSLLRDIIPGAVGPVSFGKYLSPDYMVHPGEYIPPVGPRTGTPAVQASTRSTPPHRCGRGFLP